MCENKYRLYQTTRKPSVYKQDAKPLNWNTMSYKCLSEKKI